MFVKNKVWEKLQVAIIDNIQYTKIFIHRGNWSNLKNLLIKVWESIWINNE